MITFGRGVEHVGAFAFGGKDFVVFENLNHADEEVGCGVIRGSLGAVFEFALGDVFGFAETFPVVHSYLDTSGGVGIHVSFRNSGVAEDIGDDIHCTASFRDIAACDAN